MPEKVTNEDVMKRLHQYAVVVRTRARARQTQQAPQGAPQGGSQEGQGAPVP